MEMRHIHYFIAVANALSITKAAKQLMIAQPPLSRQIRALEEELGTPLFERSHQGLHLTPEGEAFLQYALAIENLAQRSKEHLAEMSQGLQGTVDIAAVEGHAPRLLAQWIAAFRADHPQVAYTIWSGSSDEVLYRIANGLAEVGLIMEPHNAEGLHSVPVYEEPWTALIPASDPLAQAPGEGISLADLADRDLIIPSRESRLEEIRSWFPGRPPKLSIRARVAHMLNAYELARQGVGISIYPASDNHFSGDPDVVIKKLEHPDVSVRYTLVWDDSRPLAHAAEQFIRSVCQTVQADQAK